MKYLIVFFLFPLFGCANTNDSTITEISPGAYRFNLYVPLLQSYSVGIVANHASEVDGIHLVDTLLQVGLHSKSNFQIKKIFSPEHGFSGNFDAGKSIENEGEIFDSIPIVSLYGKNMKPDSLDLLDVDIILFDLQDVGVRFFTYISTLHYVMQACAENNKSLIVLDRPNPHIHYCDGPILEEKYKSFVGMHEVPIVYGMTIGEYAEMINGEGWLGDGLKCDLKVIRIENYLRNSEYNFPIKPSPNLPNMRSILLYPSLCLFEGTIMSVGRGTDFPFQVVGHPNYPQSGFSFMPIRTPGASLYPKLLDEKCYGINLGDIPMDSLRSNSEIKLNYILDMYSIMPVEKDFFIDYFRLLVGNNILEEQIKSGSTEKEIRVSWEPGLSKFKEIRKKYLIYL